MTSIRTAPVTVIGALMLAATAMPADAATELDLAGFEAVSLEGGGRVVLRHGPKQAVRILRGDATVSSFEVRNRGSLEIRACENRCPSNYKLEVEITAPDIDAIAVTGGGSIEMASGFPAKRSIALAVTGGGAIDTRPVNVRQVAAAVDGGGSIRTWASGNLAASIRGGGAIQYRGEPTLATSVRGGGTVTRLDR
jgi:hypothetical protein